MIQSVKWIDLHTQRVFVKQLVYLAEIVQWANQSARLDNLLYLFLANAKVLQHVSHLLRLFAQQ